MSEIRNKLKKHIRIYAPYLLLKESVSPEGRRYRAFLRRISAVDPVSDAGAFRKAIRPILSRKTVFTTIRYGGDSYHYGYYHELLHYAGKPKTFIPLIPMMEHGVRFSSPQRNMNPVALSYSALSSNRTGEIHEREPWRLVLVLGPYIHYSRDWYGKERFARLKKELGRVLLVFPSHTWEEDSTCGTREGTAERIMKKYAADYDTVLVCSYWKNIDDPVIRDFEALGARITSAGFRGDSNFIRRLKTIIRLADDVVVDDIGTNIGFCMYMKKRVFFEGNEETVWEDAMFAENYRAFRRAFCSESKSFTAEQLLSQQELYDRFWGGSSSLLTRAQAGKLLSALETIYKAAGYNIDRLPAAERSFLKTCSDSEQKKLIRDALSPRLKL